MTKPRVDQRMIYEVKALRAKGRTQEEIACEVGVSQGTVSIILRTSGMGGQLVRKPNPLTKLRRSARIS